MNCKEKCTLEKIASLKKEYPMFWKRIKQAFITLLLIPVIIWFLYFIGDSGYILIHTSLTVGDALSVYCSLLAFLGTVFLGAIAVLQNNNANELTKQVMKVEQGNLISFITLKNVEVKKCAENATSDSLHSPDLEIINLCDETKTCSSFFHINCTFHNQSDYPVTSISIHYGGKNNMLAFLGYIMPVKPRPIYMESNKERKVRLIVPAYLPLDQGELQIYMDFTNVCAFSSTSIFTVNLLNPSQYTYRIAQFIDINPFFKDSL